MNNIRTYEDLLLEKNRLEALLAVQKRVIHQDLTELRENIRPALDLISFFGRLTKRSSSNPLVSMGINLVGDILLGNMVLAGGSKITKLIMPFIAKTASAYLLGKNGESIFQKLAGIFKKHKSNGTPVV
jgi:hypothetical protein